MKNIRTIERKSDGYLELYYLWTTAICFNNGVKKIVVELSNFTYKKNG